jgi:hypothetical protein
MGSASFETSFPEIALNEAEDTIIPEHSLPFTPSADLAKQRRESALRFRDSSHFGGELRTQHSFWNRLINVVIYSFRRHREFLWKASS